MRTTAAPATERRDLSDIAYGFMAAKALFAALDLRLFTHLADGPRTHAELSVATGVAPNRLRTLLGALAGLGLVVVDGERYTNAPAPQRWLVRGAPGDFGEYYRLQVARQIYPALLHLDAGIAGTGSAFDHLGGLLSDSEEARTFTIAQHAGSAGAAHVLADRVPLGEARRLLDVGGGSGAFSIALCQRNPGLRATVLDFPAVVEIALDYRHEAGLTGRIDLLAGDAVRSSWPGGQDVVVLSYLLSAVGDGDAGSEFDTVLAKAHGCLRPGGLVVVHDFMLDDVGPGPRAAALWFLQYLAYRGDGVSFSATDLCARLRDAGFVPTTSEVLIPEITKVVLARKAASR
jgi:ubiquinone/menaquinone biosynthesis C-methylase UbiE